MRIPHTTKPCGIVYVGAGTEAFLPLERVEVHVDVVDGMYSFSHFVSSRLTSSSVCTCDSLPAFLAMFTYWLNPS